jgi:hypothetical protein
MTARLRGEASTLRRQAGSIRWSARYQLRAFPVKVDSGYAASECSVIRDYLLFEVILPGARRLLTEFEGYLRPSPISKITAASTAGFCSPSAVAISSFGTNRIEGRIRAVVRDPAITQ